MKKHFWKIFGVVIILVIGVAIWYSNQAKLKANEGIVIESHIKGNADSPVKLVEYSDFQCPACGAAYPNVKNILTEYGDQISFEYKHFPLITIHRNALAGAIAAEAAAQQGKFWEMHDKLFENQKVWSESANPTVYFLQYAEEIGLNTKQFKLQLSSSVIKQAVMASFNEARDAGFTGTPTFTLNDQKMTFTNYEDLSNQIGVALSGDEEQAAAEQVNLEFGL